VEFGESQGFEDQEVEGSLEEICGGHARIEILYGSLIECQ
jgi:hypothetical protein